MDKIFIQGLTVQAAIGILPEELVSTQDIQINLEFAINAEAAAAQDNITDAVDYSAVRDSIIKFVTATRFNLIETLATRLADRLLADFKLAWLSLTVVKPKIFPDANGVGVTITRMRE